MDKNIENEMDTLGLHGQASIDNNFQFHSP